MLRFTLLAASLVLASAPAVFAQDAPMACDDDTFLAMNNKVDAMSLETQKELKDAAAREMGLAEGARKLKDESVCMDHLQKAAMFISGKM